MREEQVVAKIKIALKRNGGFIFKVHGGMFQMKGMPDLLYWKDGVSYAFEVKLPSEKHPLSKLQYQILKKLQDQGVVVGVVHSAEETMQIIETGKSNLSKYDSISIIEVFDSLV